MPKQSIEVIKNGITLDSENHQNKLYVNEKGEYLVNPTDLFKVFDGQGYISKAALLQALIKVAEGKVEQRGHLVLAVRWRYRSELELSDEGLVMEMLGGVIIIGMAVVFLLLPLAG